MGSSENVTNKAELHQHTVRCQPVPTNWNISDDTFAAWIAVLFSMSVTT